ncbi:MAG: CusA/CzcA family heavy metal efflux RND transporter, partial [Bacteroidia bacterium]|nr:CusA/CzcA family heavy metal efflux RND transporter [Bacteroidia bacterium]
SMLFAVILMNVFGVSGNLMSLGALDFGLIVDGAVIIVEAVMHRLMHSKKLGEGRILSQPEMDHEVLSSSTRMMNSAVFGQVIILIVYLPIFMLEGIEGKMFKPMAQTVTFALLGAFILSLTYIPMMSSLLLSRKISHKKTFSDRMMEKTEHVFSRTLERFIRKPLPVIAGSLISFVISIVLLMNMGGEFIPELEEGDLAVDTRVMTGSNLSTTIRETEKAAALLKQKFPEVKMVVTKIGSGEIPTDPMPIEASDMMVILKDKKEWTSAKTFDELTEKMSEELKKIPGITAGFQYPVQMRFNELMTGARQDVVCKIFGEDLDTLTLYAERLGKLTREVEGTRDLYVESMTGMPQIVIRYNRQALAQYGVALAEVNKVVNAAFAGQVSGQVFEGERRFDLVLRLALDLRKDVDDVKNLLVPTPGGLQIPLYQVAEVEVKDGPNQIQREDAKRRIIVGFNVRGRDVQSIVKDLEKKVGENIQLPPGYYITYGGAFENLVEARQRLSIAVPLALAMIFLLLYFAFGSLGQGLLIFTAIPLSAIGGIIALALRGLPFSISAGIGFIALFGVAVLNGIVLLTEFNRLRAEGITDPLDIVRRGTRTRLRPVLMTAAVASLGFLPMALSNGAGAEVQRPLATVVIGGLISATFLTLVLVPILYINRQNWINKRSMKKAVVLLLLLLPGMPVSAQDKISLEAAIDSAMKNPSVTAKRLRVEYHQHVKKSSWEPGSTSLSGEFGQVNSLNNDQKIIISQELQLPFSAIRKSQAGRAAIEAAGRQLEDERLLISEKVWMIFTDLHALDQQLHVLKNADSIYSVYAESARLLQEKGSSTAGEAAYAELLRGEWQLARMQKQAELNKLNEQLNILLHTTSTVVADLENFNPELKLADRYDSSLIQVHPALLALQQEERRAHAHTLLEKSMSWPGLNIGYFNQTLKGWQRVGDSDRYFNGDDRFDGIQVGLSLPLFWNFRVSRVQSLKIEEAIAAQQTLAKAEQLKSEYSSARAELSLYSEHMKWYRENGLPGALRIGAEAAQRLSGGDIDYMQWVMLMTKSTETQQHYYETQRLYRRALIRMHTLAGKK